MGNKDTTSPPPPPPPPSQTQSRRHNQPPPPPPPPSQTAQPRQHSQPTPPPPPPLIQTQPSTKHNQSAAAGTSLLDQIRRRKPVESDTPKYIAVLPRITPPSLAEELQASAKTTELVEERVVDGYRRIRIVCLSDTHNVHGAIRRIPDGDILVHSGDFTNIGSIAEVSAFNQFLGTLPHRHKIVICGNHEMGLYYTARKAAAAEGNSTSALRNYLQSQLPNCTLLLDNLVEVDGIRFFGSSWISDKGVNDMAFYIDEQRIAEKWTNIPPNVDVLITHSPPHKILDGNTGCPKLAAKLRELANSNAHPKVHVFGHVHAMWGVCVQDPNAKGATVGAAPGNNEDLTTFINAAIGDSEDELEKPIYFDYYVPHSVA